MAPYSKKLLYLIMNFRDVTVGFLCYQIHDHHFVCQVIARAPWIAITRAARDVPLD